MRLLHTADWHLGHTLHGQSRAEEQKLALAWLLTCLQEHDVELLVVAGDIFDVASPGEDARRLYHDFLADLSDVIRSRAAALKWVVIVGGNHDSPRMLANIQELASRLNIFTVATPAEHENAQQDLLELYNPTTAKLEAVLAAVPFLQERWVRQSLPSESLEDKERALADGIHAHYQKLADLGRSFQGVVPFIATGHLYASGAQAREGQDNIYVGKLRNIVANDLPDSFDYVALGHIHRPQALGGTEHVRYSGSLIPLDFQEATDEKGVWLVDVEASKSPKVSWIPSPVSRRLKQLSGDFSTLETKLIQFAQRHTEDELEPWLELILQQGNADVKRREELRAIAEKHGARILKITRAKNENSPKKSSDELESLDELSPNEVFLRKCKEEGIESITLARIEPLFNAALEAAKQGKLGVEA